MFWEVQVLTAFKMVLCKVKRWMSSDWKNSTEEISLALIPLALGWV